ncbi:hypothetical protein [Streptomyces sp. MA5143a]|uniref:hypothetical protein n=1 Tax=Streptomyces sp. MA5143a TaxID=2083010 RepID=UPI000D2D66C4|nr:hypothetical protein [Streptomyces sp. MA5143a]SPF06651.1 hypothetical protein SMA5143A_7488 [Streptomyces sp. MA5143a]
MAEVGVPGPEPDWERAPEYQGRKRNPAYQASMWEYAASSFRLVAGLSPSLDVLAARLRLNIERGWEDLGAVDVAMFRIQEIDFALSRLENSPSPDVFVWVGRADVDVDVALGILLDALGVGEEALTFRGDAETGFIDLRSDPRPES